LLNLTWPFALLLALQSSHIWERVFWGLAALAMGLALAFTLSRGAWLGVPPALLVFAGLYGARRFTGVQRLRPYLRPIAVSAAIACLVLLLGAVLLTWKWNS